MYMAVQPNAHQKTLLLALYTTSTGFYIFSGW